jgi:hypothetical protein
MLQLASARLVGLLLGVASVRFQPLLVRGRLPDILCYTATIHRRESGLLLIVLP